MRWTVAGRTRRLTPRMLPGTPPPAAPRREAAAFLGRSDWPVAAGAGMFTVRTDVGFAGDCHRAATLASVHPVVIRVSNYTGRR